MSISPERRILHLSTLQPCRNNDRDMDRPLTPAADRFHPPQRVPSSALFTIPQIRISLAQSQVGQSRRNHQDLDLVYGSTCLKKRRPRPYVPPEKADAAVQP